MWINQFDILEDPTMHALNWDYSARKDPDTV